jgi:hypothetical protein
MKEKLKNNNKSAAVSVANVETKTPRVTKKDQIVSLFMSGMTNLEELSKMTGASLSYVGGVLQQAGLMTGYFDLYTTTANPMNVYSKFFVNKLGFKNEETARKSVEAIDNVYRQFAEQRDRAGQHHALSMALTMFDRARFTGKMREAEIFRNWLIQHLDITETDEFNNSIEDEQEPLFQADGSL